MEKYRKYYVVFILLYFAVLVAKHIGRSELVYWGGDESRHFMNGIFIKDLIADGGWRFPFEYLQLYYLKYPALSIHQYPPLFYLLEAMVFSLFGTHVAAVQSLIFTVMGSGFYYWYRYINKKFNPEVALLSLFVFMSTELFLNNFSRIMLDNISLSLALIFIYALELWHTSGKRKHLYFSLALLLGILLIAFKAYFLLFYLVVFVVYHRSSAKALRKQWLYLMLAFLFTFTLFFTFGTISRMTQIPLLYRTLQGINMMSVYTIKRLILSRNIAMFSPLKFLKVFGIPGILLMVIGILSIARNKQWGKITGDVLYAANFVFIFTLCITHFEPQRFNLFLLPVFSLLSGYACYNIVNMFKGKALYLGLAGITLFLLCKGVSHPTMYVRGYAEAARDLIALNKNNHPILCDAYWDGNFIAYMRKYDHARQQIIFRGDKLLFVSTIYYRYIKETYAETDEDIYKILDRYSIRYILVDDLFLEIPQKALLRKVLQNEENFHHIHTYQIFTNVKSYKKAGLNLYEYLDYNIDYNQKLNVSLPVMGAAFSFTVNDLRKPFDPE